MRGELALPTSPTPQIDTHAANSSGRLRTASSAPSPSTPHRAVSAIRKAFGPRRVVAFLDPTSGAPPAELASLFAGKEAVGGAVTVYVCENFACRAPLVGSEAVERAFA